MISEIWYEKLKLIHKLEQNNPEIQHLEQLIQKNLIYLNINLNESAQEILSCYQDCINDYIDLLCEQVFCAGFSFGAQILSETQHIAERILSPFPETLL